MKAFFRSKNFIVLAAVTCVLVAVIIYSACTGGGAISNIFGAVISPMQKVTAVATNNAQASLSEATRSYEDLAAENEQLKQQVNELNQQLVEFYQYKQENAQLKNYLGLKENNPDYQFVSASVINRDPNNLYYTFTLDQGSNAGVKVNDPVITDQGVVGWVSQVSAMLLEAGTTVQEGDIIVTSGIGGKFPKDLLIGKAVEVKPEENDVSLYATVEPFVDIKTVRDVIIITSFNGQGEVADNTDTNNASSNGG